jgi:aspartate aminotransferase
MKQRGLADRLEAIKESATLALNARAKQLAAEGRTIYNLTAGELASDTPEFIQKSVAKQLDKNKYTPVAGLPELRSAIADHSRDYYGLDWIEANNVVVTGGAKPALYATFLALINPGDEIIVPTPAWVSYIDLIRLVGGVVVEVPLTASYDLDVPAIKAKLTPKTKAVIVNSPHNPTGAVFSQKAVHGLAVLLKDRDITVIADDIYCRLVFDDRFVPVPKAGFDQLVIINGFSKSQALTGWRIGYLIADEAVAKAAASLLSHINGNAPLPSQYAGLAAMSKHDQPPAATLATLQKQREIVIAGLQKTGIKHNLPGGAFYIFLDLRQLTDDSAEWCEQLLVETGVALVPGEAFSTPGFARLTFVTDESVLVKALEQIKLFVDKDKAL